MTRFRQALLVLSIFCFVGNSGGALPAMIDFGQIATRADGLHAMPFSKNGHACIWFWTTNSDNGWEQVLTNQFFHWPKAEFLGMDKIALVDMGGDYAAGRASTWTLDGQRLDEQVFGNQWMRWGSSCLMPSGGAVFVNYSQETASIVLDICYRRPPSPPPSPGMTLLPEVDSSGKRILYGNFFDSLNGKATLSLAPWWTNRMTLAPCIGEIPSANIGVAELNGLIYVFITRDSAGCVMLLRLKEDSAGGLDKVDWNPGFIVDTFNNGVQDPLAPHGEFPDLHVVKDPYHNRILAMYPGDYAHVWCSSPYCRPIIIAVYPDLTKELLIRTPDYCERTIYLTCWPRPDGPYYIQEKTTIPLCSDWNWVCGGPRGPLGPVDVHFYLAASPDGWWASWGTNNDVHIQKMRFAPQLAIAKTGTLTRSQVMTMAKQFQADSSLTVLPPPENVSLSGWDGLATVEDTVNLKQWGIYGTNLTSPVLVPETKPQQFFRVKGE